MVRKTGDKKDLVKGTDKPIEFGRHEYVVWKCSIDFVPIEKCNTMESSQLYRAVLIHLKTKSSIWEI